MELAITATGRSVLSIANNRSGRSPMRNDERYKRMQSVFRIRGSQAARGFGDNVEPMRAIQYSVTGDPDVLTSSSGRGPDPGTRGGPGPDSSVRGQPDRLEVPRGGTGRRALSTRRRCPNQDGSGVVDAVGAGVEAAWPGGRVWIWEAAAPAAAGGTAQEYAVLPAAHVVRLPDDASFDLGAGLGVPFLTAHRCLTVTEDGPHRLGPGTLAGSDACWWPAAPVRSAMPRSSSPAGPEPRSSRRSAAPEKARARRARPVPTTSSTTGSRTSSRAVREIAPDGVEHVVEVAPAENAAIDAAVLAPHGTVAVYANNGGDEVSLPVRPLDGAERALAVRAASTPRRDGLARARPRTSSAAVAGRRRRGSARTSASRCTTTRSSRPADAHAAVEDGAVGKVLIDVLAE